VKNTPLGQGVKVGAVDPAAIPAQALLLDITGMPVGAALTHSPRDQL